jgi:phage shock protein A
MGELEKLNANARQALIMAADAEKSGDATKSTQYTSAAETIANQLIQVEKDVESLKTMVLESTQASDQAKAAVQQNSRLLQEKIAEKSKLLSQLDQAKMQEEMNSAMAQLTETVGGDVPSLAEVQEKIQARYAKAKAAAELSETSVESRVLEVEQATANVAAQSRLSELRAELGLPGGEPGQQRLVGQQIHRHPGPGRLVRRERTGESGRIGRRDSCTVPARHLGSPPSSGGILTPGGYLPERTFARREVAGTVRGSSFVSQTAKVSTKMPSAIRLSGPYGAYQPLSW